MTASTQRIEMMCKMEKQNYAVEDDKEVTSEMAVSEAAPNRRKLFRRLLALAGLGITGALLSQEKVGLLPPVQAANADNLIIGNTAGAGAQSATATTELDSTVTTGGVFFAKNTGSTAQGIVGTAENQAPPSADIVGVHGVANYGTGVRGECSAAGVGVEGYGGVTGIGVRGTCNGNIGVLAKSGWDANALLVEGGGGQTLNLQEWRDSSSEVLSVVDKDGQFGIGIASPVRQLHIRGSNAVARLDRNVDSASFIFVRTSSDFNTVLKSFTFGVKATGVDSGSFFIGDMHTNVSGSSDNRILIDTSGNVGIGTTTPSSKLHVNGRVKALGYDTGDITYANGVRSTEDGDGIAFYNPHGTKIAVLDAQGNLQVKGKITENPDL